MGGHVGLTDLPKHFVTLGAGRQTLCLRAHFPDECRKPIWSDTDCTKRRRSIIDDRVF
jgi:hypothetical protein